MHVRFLFLLFTILWLHIFFAEEFSSLRVTHPTLDELALKYCTDKSSRSHNYSEIYADIFASSRMQPVRFLEIGILNGASVRLWSNYFEHGEAQLYFLDIDKESVELCGRTGLDQAYLARVHCYLCDQANKQQLQKFSELSGGDFDIILDDGGHTMEQQITSFDVLFPCLRSGGIYVIEDLHTSYWKAFGGDGSVSCPLWGYPKTFPEDKAVIFPSDKRLTTIQLLFSLVDDLNYTGAESGCADYNKFPTEKFKNYYHHYIKSIQFFSSLCFIYKR